MFFLMGLTWVTEIISWGTSSTTEEEDSPFWVITNVINILRAVFIFVIIICRRPIFHSLIERFQRRTEARKIRDSSKSNVSEMVSLSTLGPAERRTVSRNIEESLRKFPKDNEWAWQKNVKQFMNTPSISESEELRDVKNLFEEKKGKMHFWSILIGGRPPVACHDLVPTYLLYTYLFVGFWLVFTLS